LTCDMDTPTIPLYTILEMFLSGVFDRYPELRVLFAETHIGWLPFFLEQIDDRYDRHRFLPKVSLKQRPSAYVREFFRFTFMEDHAGIQMRHLIGIDLPCWASDFPHAVSDWPWSQETIAREMQGVPGDERRKILALNALEWMHVISA